MNAKELKKWLEEHDWNISIDKDGSAIIERWTNDGVHMVTSLYPFTLIEYALYVDSIDPNEEVLLLWRTDKMYQQVMGNLADAYNDIASFKQMLMDELDELSVS